MPLADALRLVAPVGAPVSETTRQVVLAYPGGELPLTIVVSRDGAEVTRV